MPSNTNCANNLEKETLPKLLSQDRAAWILTPEKNHCMKRKLQMSTLSRCKILNKENLTMH